MNPNLQAICEKYNYNLPSVVDVILNRYIKEILKELSQTVPSLAVKVRTKLTMKQKKQVDDGKITVERNSKGEVMMPRYNCVTTHTADIRHKRHSWTTSSSHQTKSQTKLMP